MIEEEEEEIYLAETQQIMQKQIIYNTTEPGYRKTYISFSER